MLYEVITVNPTGKDSRNRPSRSITDSTARSKTAAQASAARGEPCILVRRETAPEDVRGMHAAAGVLTERGGITSHAA